MGAGGCGAQQEDQPVVNDVNDAANDIEDEVLPQHPGWTYEVDP
jgi:hypothetical protein